MNHRAAALGLRPPELVGTTSALEHSWAHVRPMLGRLIGTNGFNRGPVGAILGDMGVVWGCVWPCRRPCLACVGPFGEA